MTKKHRRPAPGDQVILTELPPSFIDDLPQEDQRAISEIVGKPILLVDYDDDGRAEMEFVDSEDVTHYIYVNPKFIKPI